MKLSKLEKALIREFREKRATYLNVLLTDEELKVLELYDGCEKVQFWKFAETEETFLDYPSLVGEPVVDESRGNKWATSEYGRISVTSHIE